MDIVCLDLEGVLVPEIWIAFAIPLPAEGLAGLYCNMTIHIKRFASFPTRYICLIRSCSCANSSFGLRHAPAFAGNMYLITETTLNIFSIWVVILQLLPCQSFLLYFLCIRMAYISFYNQPHPYTGIAYIPRFILLPIYAENPAYL